MKKKEYMEALKGFKEVIKLDPKSAIAYYNMAIMKMKIEKQDIEGAMVDLRKAITLNPELRNWIIQDVEEDESLNPLREDKCYECIVIGEDRV
jgi:tetratricopeptide (TPR) repeat protein